MADEHDRRPRGWGTWAVRGVAVTGIATGAWVLATAGDAVVHAHPAYPTLLVVTVVAAAAALWRLRRPRPTVGPLRRAAAAGLVALGVVAIAALAWARPATAVEPALAAASADAVVTVTESATRIELVPASGGDGTALFFQPGARVDARAYAAVLRPVAEAGHAVVIAKQPLGVAFLATGAFDAARSAHPEVARWVVGGHSLGGVVAAMEADAADSDATAPAVGLLLYASYPASDVSTTLTVQVESVSGSEDGLSTPALVEASRADLPADAEFTVVDGAVHASFGDYGDQAGDGTATTTHDAAREQISAVTVAFVDRLAV